MPLTLIGVPLFLLAWHRLRTDTLMVELRRGAWVVVHLGALPAISALGSFDGSGTLAAPQDSVLVGAVAVFVYRDAVRAGRSYIASTA